MINANTKLTAVFGNPVRHSLSPKLHNAIYEKENINAVMLAFEDESIEKLIQAMRILPIEFCAITIPHKKTVMKFIDKIDATARKIGSVNTIINRNGKLIGYNTDIIGIEKSFDGVSVKGKRALVLGAGGVAQAIIYFLKKEGAKTFVASRDKKEAELFCENFGGQSFSIKEAIKESWDIIINATPVGMGKLKKETPFPVEKINAKTFVFDCVYGDEDTRLVREAKEKGSRAISGLTMLVAQGIAQEELWLGRKIQDKNYQDLIESK